MIPLLLLASTLLQTPVAKPELDVSLCEEDGGVTQADLEAQLDAELARPGPEASTAGTSVRVGVRTSCETPTRVELMVEGPAEGEPVTMVVDLAGLPNSAHARAIALAIAALVRSLREPEPTPTADAAAAPPQPRVPSPPLASTDESRSVRPIIADRQATVDSPWPRWSLDVGPSLQGYPLGGATLLGGRLLARRNRFRFGASGYGGKVDVTAGRVVLALATADLLGSVIQVELGRARIEVTLGASAGALWARPSSSSSEFEARPTVVSYLAATLGTSLSVLATPRVGIDLDLRSGWSRGLAGRVDGERSFEVGGLLVASALSVSVGLP